MNRKILQRLITAYEAKRPVDLKQVASHELLSIHIIIFQKTGSIRSGTKLSMILSLIGYLQYTILPLHQPAESTLIIDRMARVQDLGLPKHASNFGDLANEFVNSILASGRGFNRIEIVGDRYRENSINDCTFMKRTAKILPPVVRKSIDSRHVPLPATKLDYQTFLSVKQNKAQLQQVLAKELLTHDASDKIHSLSNSIEVAARDTDVIILLLAHSHLFAHKYVLVTMGNQLYLNIGTLAANLGPDIYITSMPCHNRL